MKQVAGARNLIITMAVNYGLDVMSPMLASWREHASRAQLLIFTSTCEPSFYEACERLGVRTIEVSSAWRYSLLIDRHLIAQEYLLAHRGEFDNVLLSDARDVIFQSDPFAVRREREVSFAAEQERIVVCPFNRLWIAAVYGQDVLAELGQETISCAGTTIGAYDGVISYLALMRSEIETRPEGARNYADQGLHNYVCHKLKPAFAALDREDRIVCTLHHLQDAGLSVEGDRVRVHGAAPPIVHQWDRRKLVRDYVLQRYRLSQALLAPPRPTGLWNRLKSRVRAVGRPAVSPA